MKLTKRINASSKNFFGYNRTNVNQTKSYNQRAHIKNLHLLSLSLLVLALANPLSVRADRKSLPGLSCTSVTSTPLSRFHTSLTNPHSSPEIVFCPLIIDSIESPIKWVDVYVVDRSSSHDVSCQLWHGWRDNSGWSMWSDADVSVGSSANRQQLDLDPTNWGIDRKSSAFVRCSLPGGKKASIISYRWEEG